MDRAGARELVYCHECDNEWYRNDHGLTCPSCHSDFCEVIEQNHDPREEFYTHEEEHDPFHNPHDHTHNAPDSDEGDVGNFAFGPINSTFFVNGQPLPTQTSARGAPAGHPPDNPGANLATNFSSMLSSIMGMAGPGTSNWDHDQARPPGFPQGQTQNQNQNRTTTWSFQNGRMTYTSTISNSPGTNRAMGGTGQPAGPSDDFGQIMAGMFGPLFHPPHDHMSRSPNGQPQNPLGAFLNLLANPIGGGQHGDAVYTQEAFDRIISQMMEQNQAGNAPGPAPPEEIAALPKKKVDEKMLGENGKAECTICMDEVNLGDEVTTLYCGHWFHGDCVGAWLNSHDTCPHCRMSIEDSKAKANTSAENSAGESSSRRNRPGGSSRRSSTYSFGRRRSSTAASNASSSRAGPSGSPTNSTGSNSGGILDRARNLFRGGPSS